MTVSSTYRFDEIFRQEIELINERRRALGRTDLVALETESDGASPRAQEPVSTPNLGARQPGAGSQLAPSEREPVLRPTAGSNVVGLALSGGGVRSAAFCLGSLQALDQAGVLKNVDYLSTVSGGGYIGISLSAAMTHSKGEFPFPDSLAADEPYPVQHIRNHSNYLFPRGSINIFYNIAIYLRGLFANGLLLLPWLLLAAAITIFVKPTSESLHTAELGRFGVTLIVLCVFGGLLLAWALWRSFEISGWGAEIGSPWTRLCGAMLIVLLVALFCELQPLVLDGIFRANHNAGGLRAGFVGWLKGLAVVLAPFSAVVAFFGKHIGRLLKEGAEKPGVSAVLMRAAGKAAVYIAGAAVPFFLWIAYLYLAFAGIKDVYAQSAAAGWATIMRPAGSLISPRAGSGCTLPSRGSIWCCPFCWSACRCCSARMPIHCTASIATG